ncbi:hypothetical protein NC652_036156 [Populus alba x Populus x berolinensis]|nr:hypothetical protein NC652_036156 [Populus alba x Populus x berolinensis]
MPTNERNVVLLVHTLNTTLQIPKLMIVAIMNVVLLDTSPPQLQICILTQELSFQLSRTLRITGSRLREPYVDNLRKLCRKVSAPIEFVRKAGFTNNMGRPWPISILASLEDAGIIKWRSGRLKEALTITIKMEVFADKRIRGTLLAAGRFHGDKKVVEFAVFN